MEGINWEVGSTWFATESNVNQESDKSTPLENWTKDGTYLSTCRSAISCALDSIQETGTAFVPAFTCHSVIEPFENKGFDVMGYPLNMDLTINVEELRRLVNEYHPKVILLHGYFGLNTTSEVLQYVKELRKNGVFIIEDMTQTMFSTYPRVKSDFIVGSIRKWLPSPDGAFISPIKIPNLSSDTELETSYNIALNAKRDYIISGVGDKANIMQLFGIAEDLLDSRAIPYAISDSTLRLMTNMRWKQFAAIRCQNYRTLAQRLARHTEVKIIAPTLAEDEVPFMLPVLIGNYRGDFQQYMAKNKVYPTVIWKCPKALENDIDDVSKEIYNTILCFYIDQRYSESDMNKVADIVDSYFFKYN